MNRCLDCGAELGDSYCGNCGQAATSPIQPLWTFLGEALRELSDLDGRLLSSLRALVLHPGFLTEEFLAGRRTRHTHPIRLFLVCGAVAYLTEALVPNDVTGWLAEFNGVLFGAGTSFTGIVAAGWMLAAGAIAQRAVYHGSDWLMLGHLVLVIHTASFAMLLAPVEALVMVVLPPSGPVVDGAALMVPPIVAIYWIVALDRLFGESLPTTLLRAFLVVTLWLVLSGAVLVAFGLFNEVF